MAALRSDEEISAFEEEVKDRFGPLPRPLEHLFLHAKLKALCQRANIASLDIGTKAIAITPRVPFSAEAVAELAAANSDEAWSEGRFILPCEAGLEEQTGCAIRFLNRVIELSCLIR